MRRGLLEFQYDPACAAMQTCSRNNPRRSFPTRDYMVKLGMGQVKIDPIEKMLKVAL
jgi:hypothetical protein